VTRVMVGRAAICSSFYAYRPDFKKRIKTYDSGGAPSNKSGGCHAAQLSVECKCIVGCDGSEINLTGLVLQKIRVEVIRRLSAELRHATKTCTLDRSWCTHWTLANTSPRVRRPNTWFKTRWSSSGACWHRNLLN
jgi:hypothetical protein